MRFKVGDKVWVTCAIPFPVGGSSVDSGTECVILAHNQHSYLVETCEKQWDPGTGCSDDGTEGMRVSTFEADDSQLTSLDHLLSDLIEAREKLEELGLED